MSTNWVTRRGVDAVGGEGRITSFQIVGENRATVVRADGTEETHAVGCKALRSGKCDCTHRDKSCGCSVAAGGFVTVCVECKAKGDAMSDEERVTLDRLRRGNRPTANEARVARVKAAKQAAARGDGEQVAKPTRRLTANEARLARIAAAKGAK